MKNFLFKFFFYLGIFLIFLVFIPTLFLPKRFTLFGGRLTGFWALFCLKFFLSTKLEIIGIEKKINNEKFFIASSHQSMFETFYLQTIFNSPVFILKKELLKIPLFGSYLKKIGSISIDRNKISKDNVDFLDKIEEHVKKSKSPLIIFPQGTRVSFEERPNFKKGAGRIYEKLNLKCQPVAINSGKVWPRNGMVKKNKKITISILDPIVAGMEKEQFLTLLQNKIYSELDKMD